MQEKINVLVTRSFEENLFIENSLPKSKFKVIKLPLIKFQKLKIKGEFKSNIIIVTSKFASKYIREKSFNLSCNEFWVVGEESASIINEVYNKKICIFKNAKNLYESSLDYNKNDFLYLSGNNISYKMENIKRVEIYKSLYLKNISKEVIEKISLTKVNFLLIYSKNSAEALIKMFEKFSITCKLNKINIVAISKEVASLFNGYSDNIFSPSLPRSSEMLNYLLNYDKERK